MHFEKCDSCGAEGTLAPETKVKTEKAELEMIVPDPNNPGEHLTQKVSYDKPIMMSVKRQNVFTKKMEETEEPELEYLQPRIVRVELSTGWHERISREFCMTCLDKVKDKLKETWKMLESYDPQ